MANAAINDKYHSLGGQTGPLGPGNGRLYENDATIQLYHKHYANGSIYYTPTDGANAIYGEIYKKWIAVGNLQSGLGYPITDETQATSSPAARFNNFKNGGAIYWTAETGANMIYGEIFKKWTSLGGEASLSYPITDELSSGDRGGRYNDFVLGTIYWSPYTGAHEHFGPLPISIQNGHDDFRFGNGVAANGSVTITFYSNGAVEWGSHFHDSGAVDYNYSVAELVVDADNRGYQMGHSGHLNGHVSTVFGGSNDDNWNTTVVSQDVAANWRALVASYARHGKAEVDLDVPTLLNQIEGAIGIALTVISLF